MACSRNPRAACFELLHRVCRQSPTLRKNILSSCRPVFFSSILNRLETAQSITQETKGWIITGVMGLPWPRLLVVSLPRQRLGFSPRPVHVGFVVGGVTVGQVLSNFGLVSAFHDHSTNAAYLYSSV